MTEDNDRRRYYEAALNWVPVGTAAELRGPPLQGAVLGELTETFLRAGMRLYVCKCSDGEHERNLTLPSVRELTYDEVVAASRRYRPSDTEWLATARGLQGVAVGTTLLADGIAAPSSIDTWTCGADAHIDPKD